MRLDHLLSKEHHYRPGSVCMDGCRGVWKQSPLRRRLFCGGCSWVEYQQIAAGWFFPAPSTDALFPFGSSVLERCGWGESRFSCLAHCWVLRQQGRGVGCVACEGLRVFCRGFGCFWFPGCMVRALMAVPVFGGGWCGGCGTGLLFENYIVDASI